MPEQDITARMRATIEEELGSYRPFADLTSVELETMASRLVRAIEPLLAPGETDRECRAA